MAKARVVKFCVIVGYIKCWPSDNKTALKGRGQGHVTKFKILHPMKYLQNG